MKNRILLLFFSLIFLTTANAQKWKNVENSSFRSFDQERKILPTKYDSYELDFEHFKSMLKNAPKRFESNEKGIIINWPMPSGKMQKFSVKRSDVFHPDLAAKYPEISAYTGLSLTDPTAVLKISMSHKGIEGMLLSNRHETIYMDRYLPKSQESYILYKRSNYERELAPGEGTCTVEVPNDGYKGHESNSRFGDCQLRKFRLAMACTGEYANFHGGNVPDVLAEFNASMIRVNGIYERDFTITMELIAETDQLIYLNGNTDPYTNNDGGAMLGQNQATIDQVIGFNNYDIGHVYSTGGGGIASLRSPCTNRKARGVTGLGNPTGDPFWVDYVAHEMGHQFGGNHTQNNPCNRNSSTAMEPGSASTIMGYAGICSPNVQNNSDDYFHAVSQQEVANFVVAGNGNCAEFIMIDNEAPEITSITETGQVLPVRTPFFLTAEASDPDNDMLTYCWEQMDNESAQMPPSATSTVGPAFRSFDPSENPTRYFPGLASVLFGTNGTTWEVLPNANRDMEFNLTVRDNNELGGCTADDDLSVTFTTSAGPFMITSQNSFETWSAGETKTVTWDVANTDIPPVSCDNVDIILSLNRGQSFDIVLAENVPNDGEHDITVPFQLTSQGRIMLKCSTKTFFDLNNRDINIIAPFSSVITPSSVAVCPNDVATFTIDYTVFGSDPYEATFILNGLPAGATHTFTPAQASEDTEVILTIENLTADLFGTYNLEIVTQGDMESLAETVTLEVGTDQNMPVNYLSPEDGQIGVSTTAFLSWEELAGVDSYDIEIAESPNFANLTFGASTTDDFIFPTGLESMTVYYWRVRGVSGCVDPEWQGFQSFQTRQLSCATETEMANLPISVSNDNLIESEIEMIGDGNYGDFEVAVNITHSWVGDLVATLIAPDQTEVILFDRPGVPQSNFGCDGNDILATFFDTAPSTAQEFENTCDDEGYAIEGTFQPAESLSAFENIPIAGTWTLRLTDNFEGDGGELVSWSIMNCETVFIEPGSLLNNNVLNLNNTTMGTITMSHLEMENSDPTNTRFTLRSTPAYGEVQKLTSGTYETLEIGDTFSQEDVNLDMIRYELTDLSATDDSFIFDTQDDQFRYTSNNTFLISSSISGLSIDASITNQISCFGESDGRIEVMGMGGLPNYTYSLNEGPFEAQNVFENLGPGDYTVTVKDDIGSEVESQVLTIVEPTQITFVFFPGDNEITIDGAGGTGALTYSLDGQNYFAENTIEIFDGTPYRIYVQDENGCIAESSMDFVFYQIGGADISTERIDCKGNANGGIYINSVSGGKAPYMYQLDDNPPITFDSFTNLIAGTYQVTIIDAEGNEFVQIGIEITEPEFDLIAMSGVAEAFVSLSASGGTAPYVYSIDGTTFSDDENFGPLANGDYIGYVQDSYGCLDTTTFTIMVISTNDIDLENLTINPNPAVSNFSFSSDRNVDIEYEIIDYSGRTISKSQTSSNSSVVIEDLIPGLYFIKVNYKDATKVFKLSKI